MTGVYYRSSPKESSPPAPTDSTSAKHEPSSEAAGSSSTALMLLVGSIVMIWAFGWARSFITTVQFGRYIEENLNAVFRSSPLSAAANDVTILLPMGGLAAASLLSVRSLRGASLGYLLPPMFPWLFLFPGMSLFRGFDFSFRELLFPLFITAIFLVRPPIKVVCRTIAVLAVITSISAIALAVVSPAFAFMPQSWNVDKEMLGNSALAGLYGHSNQLGMIMALSLPFVLGAFSGVKRFVYLVLILVVALWSASRTSLLAIAAFAVVSCCVVVLRAGYARNRSPFVYVAGIMLAAIMAVLLPLTTTDPAAFTNRGLIWQSSLKFWSESVWIGWGPEVLSRDNDLTLLIGARPNTSHNVWLTFATAGGLIALMCFVVVFVVLVYRSAKLYRAGEVVPLQFMTVLAFLGMAEDPVRALHLGPVSFVVWSGLALALYAAGTAARSNGDGAGGRAGSMMNPDGVRIQTAGPKPVRLAHT